MKNPGYYPRCGFPEEYILTKGPLEHIEEDGIEYDNSRHRYQIAYNNNISFRTSQVNSRMQELLLNYFPYCSCFSVVLLLWHTAQPGALPCQSQHTGTRPVKTRPADFILVLAFCVILMALTQVLPRHAKTTQGVYRVPIGDDADKISSAFGYRVHARP
jgi:hypothetical protein